MQGERVKLVLDPYSERVELVKLRGQMRAQAVQAGHIEAVSPPRVLGAVASDDELRLEPEARPHIGHRAAGHDGHGPQARQAREAFRDGAGHARVVGAFDDGCQGPVEVESEQRERPQRGFQRAPTFGIEQAPHVRRRGGVAREPRCARAGAGARRRPACARPSDRR